MDFLELPITIPNQRKVAKHLSAGSIMAVPVSVISGLAMGSVLYCVYGFAAAYALVAIAVLPNWSCYKKEKSIEWLLIKL